jgi:GNAT superfamily N-acetyltransferase
MDAAPLAPMRRPEAAPDQSARPTRPDPPFVVRPALDHELEAAGEAVRAAYAADGLGHGPYQDVVADARDRARDAEVAVAADAGGTILGSVTFALPGSRWAQLAGAGEAEFRMLGVAPGARGRGVGSTLVEWCLDRAAHLGCRRVVLCSEQSMRTAHRIYARRGFARRPDLDWSPQPGVDLLGFAIDLTASS